MLPRSFIITSLTFTVIVLLLWSVAAVPAVLHPRFQWSAGFFVLPGLLIALIPIWTVLLLRHPESRSATETSQPGDDYGFFAFLRNQSPPVATPSGTDTAGKNDQLVTTIIIVLIAIATVPFIIYLPFTATP